MNKVRLFALTTIACLAACGSDKPAASDTAAAVPQPDSSPAVAPAPAADSIVMAPAGKAAIPSKAPVPTTAAATTTKTTTTTAAKPAAAAPLPAAQPAAPAPAAAKPAAPAPAIAAAPAPRADPSLGAPLYDANCKKCHGPRGVAVKVMQAKFPKMLPFDAAFFARTSDDAIVDILMNGKGTDMKSFKDKMSHAEMASVAAYIRTFAP